MPDVATPTDFDPARLIAAYEQGEPTGPAPVDFDPATLVAAFGGTVAPADDAGREPSAASAATGVGPSNPSGGSAPATQPATAGYAAWSDAQRALFMLVMILIMIVLIALAVLGGDGRSDDGRPLECDDRTGLFDCS